MAASTLILTHAGPLRAATLVVSRCDVVSLQNAIEAASSGDTIAFACDGTLEVSDTNHIGLSGAPFEADNKQLTIDGAGHDVTISGDGTMRFFGVREGSGLTLRDLTLVHGGQYPVISSGSLELDRVVVTGATGGGVLTYGTTTIIDSTIANNVSPGAGGGVDVAAGSTQISGSTISGNEAFGGAGVSLDSGFLSIENSTISDNASRYYGSAVSVGFGTLEIDNSTIADNRGLEALSGGGSASISISSTLLAGNGVNCGVEAAMFEDTGANAGDDSTCPWTQSNDVTTTISLGPLADNGGPTQTMALTAADPGALLSGGDCISATDQRGTSRPTGLTGCSIGAYQFVAAQQAVADCTGTAFASAFATAATAGPSTIDVQCDGVIFAGSLYELAHGQVMVVDGGTHHVVFVSGGTAHPLFTVDLGASLSLSHLTLSNGTSLSAGGALINAGRLSLDGVTVTGNSSERGGGLYNAGTAIVRNTTFAANTGGIGGAIYNDGTITLRGSTLSGDTGAPAGIYNAGGTVTLGWTIVDEGSDCASSSTARFFSNGGNVDADGTCALGDVVGDPALAALGDNGGPVETFALTPSTPARVLDTHGDCALATDATGTTRPAGACSSGAYQARAG